MTNLTEIKKLYSEWKRLRDQSDIAGDRLKQSVARARQDGVTLQRIADKLNITPGAVALWEKSMKDSGKIPDGEKEEK